MTLQNFVYIAAYFIIYSFGGWVLESITKTISQKKFVNSGFLYGPFCPIYGTGAVAMMLILGFFKGHYVLTFVVSVIVFSVWEYFVGWLLEKAFATKYWDYSYYKFNIKGRVCLVNSLTWGFLGVALIEIIHPAISFVVEKIPVNMINTATAIFLICMLSDLIVTCVKMKNINIKLDKLLEITNSIKSKMEEIKQKANNEPHLKIIEDLKQKQEELKMVIEKQMQRLRKAFPSMTSERINQFLKQRVELKRNDKK